MPEKARLIIREKVIFDDGAIMEVRLWKVPRSRVKPHGYKYSLVYIEKGTRVVGYDNSEGKGYHRHYDDKEESYTFKGIDRLVRDFTSDVENIRGEKIR